jgi:ribose/xylose/arabinose/galactoside ABC-type transport system permease subunit
VSKTLGERTLNPRLVPMLVTAALLVLLFVLGGIRFEGFASSRVFFNLFTDNAFLAIAAIGMTFVILSGGIDLSVGAVVALTGVLAAVCIEKLGWHPLLAIPSVVLVGTLIGATMGLLIHCYRLQPFIVTLAGMFFARGLATIISEQSIPIEHAFYERVNDFGWMLPGRAWFGSATMILLVVLSFAIWLAHYTRFGGYVYALGGNRQSAALMGVPIARATIGVYALSGMLAGLAGVVYSLYTASGYALAGVGLELDAIAAVVIGGTLISGGVGYVQGTLLGVLIMGLIQTWISFDGSLNSWWTKIVIGLLVLAFIVLQRWLGHKLAGIRGVST